MKLIKGILNEVVPEKQAVGGKFYKEAISS
jgi:hypothetical protein